MRFFRLAALIAGLELMTVMAPGADLSVERGPWSGAVTPTTARVKAKLARADTVARLVVSTATDFRRPHYTTPQRALLENNRVVAFALTNLEPNTVYHYALEVDGRINREKPGRLRTFPGAPASFTFAFASCARTASSHPVFTTIRNHLPLFYLNVGDFHYQDIREDDRELFRAAYDRVLGSSTQANLYRAVPFVYIWDDHDFGGNSSDRGAHAQVAARRTYQEYVPHYPLAGGEGGGPIYQAFTVGRVRFILTDLRSERSPTQQADGAGKTLLGERQKAWFKEELLAASGKYPLIFWVSSVPWLGLTGTNYYPVPTNYFGFLHHKNLPRLPVSQGLTHTNHALRPPPEDHWSVYATERREMADFIKAHEIKGVCILHGDAHMLAADDGRHGDFATGGGAPIPVLAAAPLDQHSSVKGGPYSHGVYKAKKGEGCFGLVRVIDAGATMAVIYSGRNHLNEEKVSLRLEMPAK